MLSTYNHLFKTFIVGEDIRELLKLKPKEELIQNLCQMTTLNKKKKGGHGSKRVSQNNESNLSWQANNTLSPPFH